MILLVKKELLLIILNKPVKIVVLTTGFSVNLLPTVQVNCFTRLCQFILNTLTFLIYWDIDAFSGATGRLSKDYFGELTGDMGCNTYSFFNSTVRLVH